MDIDDEKIAHARLLQPEFASNFLTGNMFEGIPLDADTVYSLVLLMPGRLLEVGAGEADRLRGWLQGHFERLLVYAYGEWLTGHNGLSGLAERAGLRLESLHSSAAVGLARVAD